MTDFNTNNVGFKLLSFKFEAEGEKKENKHSFICLMTKCRINVREVTEGSTVTFSSNATALHCVCTPSQREAGPLLLFSGTAHRLQEGLPPRRCGQ